MSKLKHTPGPWVVHGNPETLKYSIEGGEKFSVAHIITHRPLEKIEANAQLISCAPEMIEALIEDINILYIPYMEFGTVRNWIDWASDGCTSETKKIYNVILKKIDIIEKATNMKIEEVMNDE